MTRYALYFAPPPDSALHDFGSAWLGRDVCTGALTQPLPLPGVSPARIAAITEAPRHYGFHATLKPPFALAASRTPDQLTTALQAFARERPAFEIPPLRLAAIDGFLALVPSVQSDELAGLAEHVVREFDAFRAPPSTRESARRAQAKLDARERELLAIWGYPYVLDRWRFHMTLTQRLDPSERETVAAALAPLVAPVCAMPLRIDAVALFVQPEGGEPFHLDSRFALGCAANPLGDSPCPRAAY